MSTVITVATGEFMKATIGPKPRTWMIVIALKDSRVLYALDTEKVWRNL